MEVNDLKEYLGMVVDMEKDCYFQDKLRQTLEQNISALNKPQPIKVALPESKLFETIVEGIIQLIGSGAFVGIIVDFFAGTFPNGVVIGALIGAGLCVLGALFERSEYKKALSVYHSTLQEDQQRMQTELQQYEKVRSYLISEISTITDKQAHSEHLLQEFYHANVIFPKYRNLIMVSLLGKVFGS